MTVDPNIQQKADYIRTKKKGSEVRESLASGLEAMSSDVVENKSRQNTVEDQFQQVIDETTDKDVISAPEIIAARNGEPNLKSRLDKENQSVTAQLAQMAYNVTSYGLEGDNQKDNTQAFEEMMEAVPDGATIYFPMGTYIINGIHLKKHINIIGLSPVNTVIKNTSNNPALLISPPSLNDYRTYIKDIEIRGNGTGIYGEGATSGDGIVIETPYIDLENVRSVYHGGHGILLSKNKWSWSLEFKNCLIGYNKLDGLNSIATSGGSQKNDIDIINCSFTRNGKNGINIWSTNVNILRNSIDGHKEYGIKVNRSEVNATYPLDTLNIEHNYFETNRLGHLEFHTGYGSYINVIRGLNINGNYFYSAKGSDFDEQTTSLIDFKFTPVNRQTPSIRDLNFGKNSFLLINLPDVAYADFKNGLGKDSVIYNHYQNYFNNKLINTFGAIVLGAKEKVVSGFLQAKGVNWESMEQSANVESGTKVYFPLSLPKGSTLYKIGIPVFTDSTKWHIELRVLSRPINSRDDYTQRYITAKYNGSGDYELSGMPVSANIENSDNIVEITITRIDNGTTLTLGNLFYEYV